MQIYIRHKIEKQYVMEDLPGKEGRSFVITFTNIDGGWTRPNDTIVLNEFSRQVEVIKVYKLNWFKKLLLRFGYRVAIFKCREVKEPPKLLP